MHTGRNLKYHRELVGVSRDELARRLGAGWTAGEIEATEAQPQIDPVQLNKIAQALRIPADTILNYRNNPRIYFFGAAAILAPLLVYVYILCRIITINGSLVPIEGSLKSAYQEPIKRGTYITTIQLKNSPGTFKRTYDYGDLQFQSYKDRLDNILVNATAQTKSFPKTYTFNPDARDSVDQVVSFYITRADEQKLTKSADPFPWFGFTLKSQPISKWEMYKDIDLYVCTQAIYWWVPYLSLVLSLVIYMAGLTSSVQGKFIASATQNTRFMYASFLTALFLNIVLLLGCS
jgi:transcriptional regulator with XRE-family HTH domain